MIIQVFWYLKGIRIFKQLDADALEAVARVAHLETYQHHKQIPLPKEEAQLVYLITNGRVRLVRRQPNAQENAQEDVIAVLEPGDIFGEMGFQQQIPDTVADSMDETTVYVIRRESWDWILKKHPQLVRQVTRWKEWRRGKIQTHLTDLMFRSVTSRLAWFLLSLAESHGSWKGNSTGLDIRLTERDYSILIGASRDTIRRVLKAFQQDKLIRVSRRRIHILNLWELKKWARTYYGEIEPVTEPPEPDQREMLLPVKDQLESERP